MAVRVTLASHCHGLGSPYTPFARRSTKASVAATPAPSSSRRRRAGGASNTPAVPNPSSITPIHGRSGYVKRRSIGPAT
jgi:hypothetical protein